MLFNALMPTNLPIIVLHNTPIRAFSCRGRCRGGRRSLAAGLRQQLGRQGRRFRKAMFSLSPPRGIQSVSGEVRAKDVSIFARRLSGRGCLTRCSRTLSAIAMADPPKFGGCSRRTRIASLKANGTRCFHGHPMSPQAFDMLFEAKFFLRAQFLLLLRAVHSCVRYVNFTSRELLLAPTCLFA